MFACAARTQKSSGVPGRTTSHAVMATALAVLIPATTSAGEPRVHDGGFFMRYTIGWGYARTADEEDGDRIALKGVSGDFGVAVGGVVKKNLAIHATLGGWGLIDPMFEFNGREEVVTKTSMTMAMFGAGVTYYLGPSNTYLTASAGAGTLVFEFEGENHDSGTGFALEVGVGKEWWVSKRWGLGVSGTARYHSIPTGDSPGHFKGPSFAVQFSATLN